ncbi:hypothetical protein HYPSUDRAFT_470133 [Hypholoma sublateritium FD-334 SS-4]|uniref:Uncharacterized protein n=1 Tax=Hypholoma sublateritium (strain FD-334 SS-4) TaxID=945553 RepID=A0A0D2KH56_HYPSF|nr:hypothetical protein HYPSUDRAFT_470133 [Hypholoma sublateritium FD-334 SS-4]
MVNADFTIRYSRYVNIAMTMWPLSLSLFSDVVLHPEPGRFGYQRVAWGVGDADAQRRDPRPGAPDEYGSLSDFWRQQEQGISRLREVRASARIRVIDSAEIKRVCVGFLLDPGDVQRTSRPPHRSPAALPSRISSQPRPLFSTSDHRIVDNTPLVVGDLTATAPTSAGLYLKRGLVERFSLDASAPGRASRGREDARGG